jgi:hypothetical protein
MIFVRLIEQSTDEKATALLQSVGALRDGVEGPPSHRVFERVKDEFEAIPSSPFAYWLPKSVLDIYRQHGAFEAEGRLVLQGPSTTDDFRFIRAWFEVNSRGLNGAWMPHAKGGVFSMTYADCDAVLNWHADGREAKSWNEQQYAGHWSRNIRNVEHYGKAALTFLRRTHRLTVRALPSGAIFSDAQQGIRVPEGQLLAWLGFFQSTMSDYLVKSVVGRTGQAVQFVPGMIGGIPVPQLSNERYASAAWKTWRHKYWLDSTNETSHAFVLPPGPSEKAVRLDLAALERELAELQHEIDDTAYEDYGISAEDRAIIEAPSKSATTGSSDVEEGSDDAHEGDDEATVGGGSDALGSWLVGVAFARFDPRLATGERAVPPEPEPFDPLPPRSPGMYPEGEEPADRPDILVDDEGHPDDLAARAIAVAERVKVAAPEHLRAWLTKEFFPLHIKMYSKSRRKAPIYWQLATPSAGYSVWLYIHAFSKDTLFRVQNDYVAPKLAHEERRLESLTRELGDGATATQRKQLAAQEALVEELRAFLDEVKRVAPLWNPNLDDGVIINFAPLWRLVPQNKAWQKELKSTWDALADRKYDWADLAMHLWPERVVSRCAKDRSLAIAHGLEDVFWVEGTDGKWTARRTPTKSVDELVKERTSPAVKSALKSLLEAPVASGKSTGRKSGGRRKAAAATEGGEA